MNNNQIQNIKELYIKYNKDFYDRQTEYYNRRKGWKELSYDSFDEELKFYINHISDKNYTYFNNMNEEEQKIFISNFYYENFNYYLSLMQWIEDNKILNNHVIKNLAIDKNAENFKMKCYTKLLTDSFHYVSEEFVNLELDNRGTIVMRFCDFVDVLTLFNMGIEECLYDYRYIELPSNEDDLDYEEDKDNTIKDLLTYFCGKNYKFFNTKVVFEGDDPIAQSDAMFIIINKNKFKQKLKKNVEISRDSLEFLVEHDIFDNYRFDRYIDFN